MSLPTCSIQVNPRGYKSEVITYCLKQFNISIPVVDYKTDIINLRNSVVHKGIDVGEKETRDYLAKCRTIIDEYEPSIIGNDLI